MATEICVQVFDSYENLIKNLISNNYVLFETFILHDKYFSKFNVSKTKQQNYADLLSQSCLIRTIEEDKLLKKQFVYKNKILDKSDNVISETKTFVNIDNEENLAIILNNIGLNCWCDYFDKCEVYKKDKVEIAIQILNDLGIFIEIEEYKEIANLSANQKFEQLKNIVKRLNIKTGDDYSCKKPYMFLQNHTTRKN